MNTPKWIPKHSSDTIRIFEQSHQLECDFRILGKRFTTDVNWDLPDYYDFEELITNTKRCFELSGYLQTQLRVLSATSADKNIERSPYKTLQAKKANIIRSNLKRKHFQLLFVINRMIKIILGMSGQSEMMIDTAFYLCTIHNEAVQLAIETADTKIRGAQVCSNSFPTLMSHPKKINVEMVLQIISKQRAEQCCHSLISCLLATCKTDAMHPQESDTSSVEILRALTAHLGSPTKNFIHTPQATSIRQAGAKNSPTPLQQLEKPPVLSDTESSDPAIRFFDNLAIQYAQHSGFGDFDNGGDNDLGDSVDLLEHLVTVEENFVATILLKCLQLCPTAFEGRSTKKELKKLVDRGSRGLWTQVGGTLDHVVLWWSASSLACRPPSHAKHLRDWLLIMQPEDAPEPVLSTIRGLGETLTVHVTGTIWDKQFRLALVASSLPADYSFNNTEFYSPNHTGTTSGRLWSELLYSLTSFCNSCDQKGTIPSELPIVEQIPVLHRLDHSVHTMRIWAASVAKLLCTDWNMQMFFRVVTMDIGLCLQQLQELRVPVLVAAQPLEVLVQVCVALREKLVSEIKVNIDKLKQTAAQCIEVLASICRITSLATLSLCFPASKLWQTQFPQTNANEYVNYILTQIYLPVLEATTDAEILSLILKIICEAWLDHIYGKKIKFSRCGALNLLRDFDGVSVWITDCAAVPSDQMEALAKHEVLRMCEGVGRILLRKPQEIISMVPSPRYLKREPDELDEKPPLPPEMFVPNQELWLQLRAKSTPSLGNCFCACNEKEIL